MDRAAFLSGLIGRPWSVAASCWHLAVEVERALWGRDLPDVVIPEGASWRWMMEALAGHEERAHWREVPAAPGGLVTASDGALVLMARAGEPAHVGVWLAPEGCVLHADSFAGVTLDPVVMLRARGWARLRMYEPI